MNIDITCTYLLYNTLNKTRLRNSELCANINN